MGQNSVSRVRLHYGTWHRGRNLPCVRPYCTRTLGPKLSAGACRRPFYCSERPESGLGRPEGAQNALKWPKITGRGGCREYWGYQCTWVYSSVEGDTASPPGDIASLPRCLVAWCSSPQNSQKGASGAGDQWLPLVLFVFGLPLASAVCHYPMGLLLGVHGKGTTPTYPFFSPWAHHGPTSAR